MRPAPKRGRRSRPSSLASEDIEIPLKRTRSTGSSPGRSSRSTPTFNSRRLEHNTRPTLTKSNSTNSNKHSLTSDFLARRDTSPILEALSDQESVTPMAPGPKLPPEGDTAKDKDLKRLPTPSLPPPVASADTLDGHISDSSSLSELDDSEAETERLEDSPRKPKPVFVANPVSKSSRLPPTKLHLEIKQNKSTDISMGGVHEDDPQTQGSISKKRKREHTVDVRQKEPTEEKASRPATPLMKKDLAVTDKSKKSKGEEVHQSKAGNASNNVSPSKPVTNGRGLSGDPEHSFKADDQEKISPESQSQVEKTTDTSIDKHSKEGGSPGDDEVEADDETVVEASREDEEDAERLQKRKAASEALMQIELEFARLREKLFEEKISDIDEEIKMVDNGTHPELLAMMEAIDKRRDDKTRLYDVQFKYALGSHETAMKATRAQLHSQYFQDVREIRSRYLDNVSETLYQLQRERRASDTVVPDYTYRISADRATRVRERQAYTMEVSILSGIAKYIGFPAAPEVKGASISETQQDLEAMGIVSRIAVRGTLSRRMDDFHEMHPLHWQSRPSPPLPPPINTQIPHHHHHHPHSHAHHHHIAHAEPPLYAPRRAQVGTSAALNQTQLSPVTPLPLSALLMDSGPIKMEQVAQQTSNLPPHYPMNSSHPYANRSPLRRQPPPPQAHIHQLQHHQSQNSHALSLAHHPGGSYGNHELHRRGSNENGESSMKDMGPERRMMDEKDAGPMMQEMEVARYGPVGKGYV